MAKLTTLQTALNEIKRSVENAIKSTGTEGKNNLIRSQKPIKLLHEVIKTELIRNKVNPDLLNPSLGKSYGEMSLAGFFKKKDQDVCVSPNDVKAKMEILKFQGILYGQEDEFGFDLTQQSLSINIRSQLSSIAKNFDTLYERTFAEPLNLHLKNKKLVMGEVYLVPLMAYDPDRRGNSQTVFREKLPVFKYISSFQALNN